MKISIKARGIKVDDIIIKGRYYTTSQSGVCFVADSSIFVQAMEQAPEDKKDSTNRMWAYTFLDEFKTAIGAEIHNDSDIMRDYFDDDSMRFDQSHALYSEIMEMIRKADIADIKRSIKRCEQQILKGKHVNYNAEYIKRLRAQLAQLEETTAA